MKLLLPSILCCCLLISCVRSQSTVDQKIPEENVQSENKDALCNIIDSLLIVYPKAMENPIQKTDFIEALGKSIKSLTADEMSMLVSQIPFNLYEVQNEPNQPGGKYLVAFEYYDTLFTEGESTGDGYATIGDQYNIKLYCFAAFDKEAASKLVKNVKYILSGDAELIDKPTFGGWDNDEITFGIEIKNATATKK
ncbi:hypothetical protein [uncultured Muribaculum sp.]|uniref:hypothetical protein n=1 Tax=uncultured Muribaculum sp. TaxID=1918613 RepID=UPI0025AF3FA1|nr:hypothetical protein [uncultured Muribaculum sp.]